MSPLLVGVVMAGSVALLTAQEAPADVGAGAAEAPESVAAPTDVQPTLEAIFQPPRVQGLRPRDVSVSANGRWATWRWTDADAIEPEDQLWLAPTDGGEARVLFEHDDDVQVRWTGMQSWLLVQRDGWIDLYDADGHAPSRPLFEGGQLGQVRKLEDPQRVVFRTGEDNQIWVLDVGTGRRWTPADALDNRSDWYAVLERSQQLAVFADAPGEVPADDSSAPLAAPAADGQASGEGSPRVLYLVPLDGSGPPRELDFEQGDQVLPSPDGRWVARWATESAVSRNLIMADYLSEAVKAVPVRSSLAGDPAAKRSLELFDTESAQTFTPPLAAQQQYHVRRTRWSPDGRHLLVDRLSNDFKVRELLLLDPATRQVWPVHAERDEAWIGGPTLWADWTEDGDAVLFTSEQTGYNHLYRVPVQGGPPEALTAGTWEVLAVQPIPRTGRLLLRVNSPLDPAVQQLQLLDVGRRQSLRLTSEAGCALGVARGRERRGRDEPVVSADGSTIVYSWETLGMPGDLFAIHVDAAPPAAAGTDDGHAGATLTVRGQPQRLTDSVPQAYAELALIQPDIVEYTNPDDDRTVRSFLYLPQPFDPDRAHPAVVFVHGAGYLQNVTRSATYYNVDKLFHQRLARRGYVVLAPDFRHSAGYGRDYRTDIHGHMGGKDLDDVVAGVDYLESLGYVDTARVGIYGGSYGGFLTLMALFTKPDVFACGAALRSVTDWRSYHAWYTNPRLGTPQDDPDNYAASSPLDHAEGLSRPVLLLHGLKDDNVFAQDTIRLMEKLIQLGKSFDVMLYPSQAHGFTDPASWIDEYGRIERFFDRHLQP